MAVSHTAGEARYSPPLFSGEITTRQGLSWHSAAQLWGMGNADKMKLFLLPSSMHPIPHSLFFLPMMCWHFSAGLLDFQIYTFTCRRQSKFRGNRLVSTKVYCHQSNINRSPQSRVQKEEKLYSGKHFANWENIASARNCKCVLLRQRGGHFL